MGKTYGAHFDKAYGSDMGKHYQSHIGHLPMVVRYRPTHIGR